MKVKIAEWIAKYLVEKGITTDFTVPGGGAMHLDMAFAHQEGMKVVYVQHEQAASIAAEGYYKASNKLPLVCVTTGPGGTNALTGVMGAYVDSIPMFIISGQVKWSTTPSSTMMNYRCFGDQDFDIVNTVKTMTKFSVLIDKPEMVKYYIDKALYIAMHGRRGPVWLDIPLNIQWGYIDTNEFVEFEPNELANIEPRKVSPKLIQLVIEKLKNAKRPVIYSGAEIRSSDCYNEFRKLIEKLGIPVVTSYDGIDVLEEDNPLYAGRAGDFANRYGNWTVQNSDFILSIGSRLGVRQVNYSYDTWAREAFVAMVNPDPLELVKPTIHVELPIRADYKDFILNLYEAFDDTKLDVKNWIDIIHNWKDKYPVVEKRHYEQKGLANPYAFIDALSRKAKEGMVTVSANGTACVMGGSAYIIKKDSRYILNAACASMGYGLPAAIGACFAQNNKETYCLTGDGSIQMNLQELQTLVFHKLPIKIFVINNAGYHSMRQTETNLFNEQTKSGVGPESNDLSFPNMSKIAQAYEIPYVSISSNEQIDSVLDDFLSRQGYGMCEIFVDKTQFFEMKPIAMKKEDGTLMSPPLEDLWPFLPKEELEKIMLIPLTDFSKKRK